MENYLEYKGFRGSVEYSRADDILHGKVIGIRDLVSYEGSSIQELKRDFQGAINDYIASLKMDNIPVFPPVYKESLCSCQANW